MEQDATHRNIQDLNLQYLLCVRDHAVRSLADACARFGVETEFARAVVALPLTDLQQVAMTDSVLFKSSLSAEDLSNLARTEGALRSVIAVMAASRDGVPGLL